MAAAARELGGAAGEAANAAAADRPRRSATAWRAARGGRRARARADAEGAAVERTQPAPRGLIAPGAIMGLSLLQPRHLARYKDLLALVLKYGRSDLLKRARLEEVLGDELDEATTATRPAPRTSPSTSSASAPRSSSSGSSSRRARTSCPSRISQALARLQDDLAPVPFAEIEATVRAELGVRLSKAFLEFDATPDRRRVARPGAPRGAARRARRSP